MRQTRIRLRDNAHAHTKLLRTKQSLAHGAQRVSARTWRPAGAVPSRRRTAGSCATAPTQCASPYHNGLAPVQVRRDARLDRRNHSRTICDRNRSAVIAVACGVILTVLMMRNPRDSSER